MADILIEHGTIITMNPGREIIEDGAVAVVGNSIVDVGPTAELAGRHVAAKVIDAAGGPVLPGFVNAHHHLYSMLHKGAPFHWEKGDLWTFLDVVYRRLLPGITSQQDRYTIMLLPLVEMIKAGFTCTIDLNEWLDVGGAEAALEAFDDAGMRGAVARSLQDHDRWDVGGPVHSDVNIAVAETVDLVKRWKRHERVDAWFYLVTPLQCSDELTAEATQLAEAHQVGVATHLHEVPGEVARWREETGSSPIQYYHEHAIPYLTPRHNAGHCVHLDDRDIEILAETGVKPVHNSVTNATGAGLMPISKLHEAGVPVALGVDDGPTDMFEVMRSALRYQKLAHRDATALSADRVLEMATLGGAKAMLLDDRVGSLEVGKRADLVVLDLRHPRTTPVSPPIGAFVTYCATPENVDTVVIDGAVVMEGRKLTTVDEDAVVARAQEIMDRLGTTAGWA